MHKLQLTLVFLFCFSTAHATLTYTAMRVYFHYDDTQGTFVNSGGKTRGAIVGFNYLLQVTDDATGLKCYDGGVVNYSTPLLSVPIKSDILNDIKTSAINDGVKDRLKDCLRSRKKILDDSQANTEDVPPNLDSNPFP